MTLTDALKVFNTARERGITLTYDGANLHASGPALDPTDSLIPEMRAQREGLIELLSSHPDELGGESWRYGVWQDVDLRKRVRFMAEAMGWHCVGFKDKLAWMDYLRSANDKQIAHVYEELYGAYHKHLGNEVVRV